MWKEREKHGTRHGFDLNKFLIRGLAMQNV
jgi:hypothetical protein